MGGAMIEAFTIHDWEEGVPMVYAMESSCHCMMHFVHAMSMGKDVDFFKMIECVNGMVHLFTGDHDMPMFDEHYQIPEGADVLIQLWMENPEYVGNWTMHPYHTIMYWADH